jgi:hypothetical protein
MSMPTPKEHYEEGHRYVLQGLKVMLALNGGAAIAILTFIGHEPTARTSRIAWAMLAFGGGAFSSALCFLSAYLTQLAYGNEAKTNPALNGVVPFWQKVGYALYGVSALLFWVGLLLAICAFPIPSDTR